MANNSNAPLTIDPAVTITLAATSVFPVANGALLNSAGLGPTAFGTVTLQQIATAIGTIGGVSAAGVTAGTFGSDTSETGTYTFPGALVVTGAVTAVAGIATAFKTTLTATAIANNDVLRGHLITLAAGTPGAFTGLVAVGLDIAAFTVAGYTTPGNPFGLRIGVITGTGASVATALQLAPPTGATTNYLIAHTTAGTFNVTGVGLLTTTGGVVINSGGGLMMGTGTGGNIALGAAVANGVGIAVAGASNIASATSQYGISITYTGTSAATVATYGINIAPTTAATAYVTANFYGAYIDAVAKGVGSTITNRYGLFVVAPTDGATINHAIYTTGSIVSAGATQGIGYTTGAGGAQTQGAGSGKSTTVVSNTITTAITMNNAALNTLTIVSFTFTNSAIAATDHVLVEHQSAGTMGCYDGWCTPAGGSGTIYIKNISAGSLSEAIVIRVTVIKAVNA